MWQSKPKPEPQTNGVSRHIAEANRLLQETLAGTGVDVKVILENLAEKSAKEEAVKARTEALLREIAMLKDERDRLIALLEKSRPGPPAVQGGQQQPKQQTQQGRP